MKIAGRELPPLPPWAPRVARYAGYPLFGLLVFLMSLYLSVPWERVKDRVEAVAQANGWNVTIDSLGPAFLLGLKARGVALRTRPMNPADKPARFVADEVVAHPGLLGLLFNRFSSSFSATAFGGDISGDFSSGGDLSVDLDARDIDLGQIPGLESMVKLPLGGMLRFSGDLSAPKGPRGEIKFGEAHGEAKLLCKGCSLGDGKTKVPLPGVAFFAEGLTVPRMSLGNFEGKMTIEKGVARISGLEAHGPDMDAKLEGDVTLRDPVAFSTANLCLAFRPTPALLKREAKFEILQQAPDLQNVKRSDGYYGIRISGRLDAMFFQLARCGAGAGGSTTSAPAPRPSTGFVPPPPAVAPAAAPSVNVAPPPAPPPPPPEPAKLPDAAPVIAPIPARSTVIAAPPQAEPPPPPPPSEEQQ